MARAKYPSGHRLPVAEALAGLLATRRRALKLKQTDVARLLGRSQSFVSEYEACHCRLTVLDLLDLCRALKLDPAKVVQQIRA